MVLLDWTTTDRWQHVACYKAGPGRACRLSVERMAGAGWDWTVWCAQDTSISLHGTAANRVEAIRAAERALPDLGCTCLHPAADRAEAGLRCQPAYMMA